MRSIGVHILVALVMCMGASTVFAQTQEARASSATKKPPTILFMCPHGAAKSVLASAYFQRVAKERGFNVQVRSAGTDPDPTVSSAVASHLKTNGYDIPVAKPRRATEDDMAVADIVISIGCDLGGLPKPRGTVHTWDDVPALSEEFAAADAKIRERVMELIDQLVRQPQRR
jgi:arsenate reductase (thioredoxin)